MLFDAVLLAAVASAAAAAKTQVFVGSKTVDGSFTSYALGADDLGLTFESVAASPKLPRSWQGLHPTLDVVFTVEQSTAQGPAGAISAYTFNTETGLSAVAGSSSPRPTPPGSVCHSAQPHPGAW